MRAFLQDRIRLVNELVVGGPEVAYADLVLILTAVISGCAAARWPGSGIDRNRYVELLVRYSPAEFHCDYVCVAGLLRSNLIAESETPWGKPGDATRIYTDEEIDMSLSDARLQYPNLSVKDLKNHAFATLVYSWLRCSYAHEYALTRSATHMPASQEEARISYIGRLKSDGGIQRMSAFHLQYLIRLASHHADHVAQSPQPRPSTWWLQQP